MKRAIAGQEARETASLGSLPSEAPSARPGARNGPQSASARPASLRARVEAELAAIDAEALGPRLQAHRLTVTDVTARIRDALAAPNPAAARERIRRQAEYDAGRCAQGCGRDRRHGKRTCGLCPGSRPRAAKDR